MLTLFKAVAIHKRACTDESATIGFAAGTTGGAGGTTTTVSTLTAAFSAASVLKAAVAGTKKKVRHARLYIPLLISSTQIVIVNGTITGNTVLRVGSNTSIIGKSGSCASLSDCLARVGLRC